MNSTFDSTPRNKNKTTRNFFPSKNKEKIFQPYVTVLNQNSIKWERISRVIEKNYTNQQEKIRLGFRHFKKQRKIEQLNLPFLNTKYYLGISTQDF